MTDSRAAIDVAYANASHIPGGMEYPARWAEAAAAFRERHPPEEIAYGAGARQRLDLFRPEGEAKGAVIFVHGGFWRAFDKSSWSHLAEGALAHGWAVAMPSYTLAPEARIAAMTREIEAAIGAVAEAVPGPLRLAGHSAGGHLVARMACADLSPPWRDRVARIVPISPLSDLRPLMGATMNDDLRLDREEAEAESPLLCEQVDLPMTVWVGAAERPAFIDQARWLAERRGCELVEAPGRHHFDVIEELAEPDSPLTETLLG
ncbi:alpha/beta hydrolase [Limimaricola cinnabarinus]|jgi:acetyl esterase/lipase|uniref:Alpha/beta hydrolase n=1 Tax=Limimaricola cinnabarinus TaxID=1125964 RepID=A0A2G1MII7_9RHOB|nr:alpha/beta hydrolase [Limimaricola cinnabarinus]PHP28558.1 alpha/beta hydrolase [Limimaricola cinnabarinus]